METCKLFIESAGIIVASPDMTVCYDERGKSVGLTLCGLSPYLKLLPLDDDDSGAKYELPKFVLSLPTNIVKQ